MIKTNSILFICYLYKPINHISVQRLFHLVAQFSESGYEVTVLTADHRDNPDFANRMEVHVDDISVIRVPYRKSALDVLKSRLQTTSAIKRRLKKIYRYFILPLIIKDEASEWVKHVIKNLDTYVHGDFSCVFTSGPPHSIHSVGYLLKQKNRCSTWIADFRDRWSSIASYKRPAISEFLIKHHERDVFSDCDLITYVADDTVPGIYRSKSYHLLNGFDESEFSIAPEYRQTDKFTITYTGNMYGNRDPDGFLVALSHLIKENYFSDTDICIQLYGAVHDYPIDQKLSEYGLRKCVRTFGWVDRKSAIKAMAQSDVLLLILAPEHVNVYAGKLFEYVASKRPIFAIVPGGGVVDKFITTNNIGWSIDIKNIDNIKIGLKEAYGLWKNNSLVINNININKYSRKNINKEFIRYLEDNRF